MCVQLETVRLLPPLASVNNVPYLDLHNVIRSLVVPLDAGCLATGHMSMGIHQVASYLSNPVDLMIIN